MYMLPRAARLIVVAFGVLGQTDPTGLWDGRKTTRKSKHQRQSVPGVTTLSLWGKEFLAIYGSKLSCEFLNLLKLILIYSKKLLNIDFFRANVHEPAPINSNQVPATNQESWVLSHYTFIRKKNSSLIFIIIIFFKQYLLQNFFL